MKNPESLDKLLRFIKDTQWEDLDPSVQKQAIKCFLDLAGVLTAGAKNHSAKTSAKYVAHNYPAGDCTIFSTGEKTNLIGAAMANGMAANALDLDDGFSLLRGHPGSGFFGALLSAAEISACTYGEFLAALVVSYEVSIRQGFSVRNYYGWDHSTGCYSAFSAAAGIGKLLKLDLHQLEMAISTADFIAPLNPAKRSCYYPSMNKDGVYFGQHAGAQAVMMALDGITGRYPVILDDPYISYIDTLGEKFYFFDLYIKFYSACRWAHGPICAIEKIMTEHPFALDQIEKIDVHSFGYAGTLYKEAPKCEDEAQYNIKYPLVAQLLFGNCGPLESSTTKMLDHRVPDLIKLIEFHYDEEYDSFFPARRICRVEITLKDGTVLNSGATEPKCDVNANVSLQDIKDKILQINTLYAPEKMVSDMIEAICSTSANEPFDTVLQKIKQVAATNDHPEYQFI